VSSSEVEIDRLRREIHRASMRGAELLDATRAMCDALEPTADDLPVEHRVLLARLRAAAGPDPEAARALQESLRRRRDSHTTEV